MPGQVEPDLAVVQAALGLGDPEADLHRDPAVFSWSFRREPQET
ncbi:hypothetical protein [Streptomyces sp. NPDC055681]